VKYYRGYSIRVLDTSFMQMTNGGGWNTLFTVTELDQTFHCVGNQVTLINKALHTMYEEHHGQHYFNRSDIIEEHSILKL